MRFLVMNVFIIITQFDNANLRTINSFCYFKENRRVSRYVGTVHVAVGGATCQQWTDRFNDKDAYRFPDDESVKAAKNYCRDPDGSGYVWCYVDGNPKVCDVPKCKECFDLINGRADYRGTQKHTMSGLLCQMWLEQFPNYISFMEPKRFYEARIKYEDNFCRDPDFSGYPWCYVKNTKGWEPCGIPKCEECYYQIDGKVVYNGTKAVTRAGLMCQRWDEQSPHAQKFGENVKDGKHNYCRDPDNSHYTWCYTMTQIRWQACAVPVC